MTIPAPPYDAELAAALPEIATRMPPTILPADIPAMRARPLPFDLDELLARHGVDHAERRVQAPDGAELTLSVFTPRAGGEDPAGRPGIFYLHGGGMIFGERFSGLPTVLRWLTELGAIGMSLEYRLAPEHPDPVPVEDCYAGLRWAVAHAGELGFDPARLVIAGISAGGGLAAGTALLARDRGGPPLCAQLLICPMLDDRNESISSRQFQGVGVWDRISNDTGWDALLGERRGTDAVSAYAAPARATDLGGLPPTFIDVGSAEVFRDEDVAYASRIWAAGGEAELHVWQGGFHGFDGNVPEARVSVAARETRTQWLRRRLGAPPQ